MKTAFLFLLAATLALPAADSPETKPGKPGKAGRAALVPDINGVAKEDMAKFRVAAMKSFRDPEVVAAREKLKTMGANTQFLSGKEKADMKEDFEAVAAKVRDALAGLSPEPWHEMLATDVARLAMLYATWTGEERVEVRIERVTGNGCWKF
mgnify:CR=1 FL=1